jgi:hypothetical protein
MCFSSDTGFVYPKFVGHHIPLHDMISHDIPILAFSKILCIYIIYYIILFHFILRYVIIYYIILDHNILYYNILY